MRSREELVTELIQNPLINRASLDELAAYGWDCDKELVAITANDVIAILTRFLSNEFSADQVQSWANRIEARDDIGYEGGGESIVNEAIFWLANPFINWPIDENLCKWIEVAFAKGHYDGSNTL